MKKLKMCQSLSKAWDYLEENGIEIGCGSSRCAFLIKTKGYEKSVIKIAISEDSIGQTKEEVTIWLKSRNKFLPRVFNWHPKYWWIEMEFLKSIKSKDFKNVFGIDICSASSFSIMRKKKNKNLKRLSFLHDKYGLLYGDILVLEHWGRDYKRQLKIRDFGYTESVAYDL